MRVMHHYYCAVAGRGPALAVLLFVFMLAVGLPMRAMRTGVPAVTAGDSAVARALPLKALDVRPEYPGGREAIMDYVDDYFKDYDAKGTPTKFFRVRVGFFIEPDGRVTGARVLESDTPTVNDMVVAMLLAMPRWKPGMKDGKAVRTRYSTRIRIPDYSSGLKIAPEFPGGKDYYADYLKGGLKTDGLVEEGDEPVRVVVEATVKADGSIVDAHVVDHGSESMDAEAMRVIAAMPRWTPGTIDGVPADMPVRLPVTFSAGTTDDGDYTPPEFPGGKELWHKYVRNKLQYPEYSSIAGRSGVVVVRFTVEKDGSITNPNVVKHAAADMDSAAIRLVAGMPRINPATRNGSPVRVRTSWRVYFNSGEDADTRMDMDRLRNRDKWWENGGRRRDGRKAKRHAPRVVYVVDGQEVESHVVDHIDAKAIKTFKTLSPKEARARFGSRAADGAIEITTNNK